jgi:NAD(P)-dependent dehydrogenase (short-subunit alcohol dehydrogenase family)
MSIDALKILVTGAATGIGAATATLAASRGAHVLVSDVNDEGGLALVEEIRQAGGTAHYKHCDVSDEEQVKELMQAAAETLGGLDVLHNNAGIHETILGSEITLETMSRETYERVLGINLVGPFMCAKYALPLLKQSSNASIINAGSTGSFSAYEHSIAYGSSKGGIAMLTKNLAVDLAPHGIRVNCYCPGTIKTQMVENFIAATGDADALISPATLTHLVPRLGETNEVAELVCFLASDQSSFVNGVVWLIDGGSLAWRGTIDALGMKGEM